MEKSKKAKSAVPAFNFCNVLKTILTTAVACQSKGCCQQEKVYLPRTNKVVFKDRVAKPEEVSKSTSADPAAFELRDIPRRWQRTAKHKRFITDTGATVSVTNRADIFLSIDDYSPNKRVQVANSQFVDVVFTGTVQLDLRDKKGKKHTVLLRNVCYSPLFAGNLLSVREMAKQFRYKAVFGDGESSYFKTPEGDRININEIGSQYMLEANALSLFDPVLWHRRFMHASTAAIRRMACKIDGLKHYDFDFSKCDACLQGGAKKLPLKSPGRQTYRRKQHLRMLERDASKKTRFSYFGQRIATDLCGPFPESVEGHLYAIVLHDSWSGYIAVYTLPDKRAETVLDALYRFIREHEKVMPNGLEELWTDNGGEYHNSAMDQFCEEICVKRSYTVPYNSWQNPYAERANGTVLRKVRTTLADADISHKYWSYAIRHAALINNVLCDDDCISPYEQVYQEKFDYFQLHVPFCACYYLLPEHERENKVSPRALPARYLGIDPERNGHLLEVPGLDDRITTGFHVVFNEDLYFDQRTSFRGKTMFRGTTENSAEPIGKSRRQYHEARDHDTNAQPRDANAQPVPLRDDLPTEYHPADDEQHGTTSDGQNRGEWHENHCRESRCVYPRFHTGPHSHMEVRDHERLRPLHPHRYTYSACATPKCIFHVAHGGKCMDDDDHIIDGGECSSCDEQVQSVLEDATDPDSIMDDLLGTVQLVIDESTGEVLNISLDIGDIKSPDKYEEAIKGALAKRWNESMLAEITAILESDTWETISRKDPKLRGRIPTKSRWVYTIKYKRNGDIEKFKSRFVVCGYSQRQGIDYDRAFSSTLRATTFRCICACAAGEKLKLDHFDVTSAFTQADLDDVDLFVEPPKGFEEWECCGRTNGPCTCGKRQSKLLHLKKALYGSKQASRLWQETLRKHLVVDQGFISSPTDPCLFTKTTTDGKIIVGTYVDDLVVAWRGVAEFEKFDSKFRSAFRATHLGKLDWFLGMGIDQHDDFSVELNQTAYIEKMAAKFIDTSASRIHPPKDIFESLDRAQTDLERARVADKPYMSLIGSLLYSSVMSRPDTCYHTSILAKFMSDPSPDCYKAAVQLMEYLYTTRHRKLVFSGKVTIPVGLEKVASDITRNNGFYAYSDSSWGNKYPYPMFGHCIYIYGSLVSYSTKQLKLVAFSSCEAEYAAASACCKEMEFVRNVCFDLGMKLQGRLVLAVDNTAVIDVAHDVGVSARTKHFDRAIHYLRDLVQLRRVIPVFVRTHIQRADGLTKALDKSKFLDWLKMFFV